MKNDTFFPSAHGLTYAPKFDYPVSTPRKIHKDTFLIAFFSLVRKERKGQKEESFNSRLGDAETGENALLNDFWRFWSLKSTIKKEVTLCFYTAAASHRPTR